MSTLARRDIRLAVVAALQTIPGLTVKSPGAWDSTPAMFPEAKARATGDHKAGKAKTMPTFDTTVNVEVKLSVQGESAEAAQDALEALCGSVEIAVLGSPALMPPAQQVVSVDTQSDISTDGAVAIGVAVITFGIETFEAFDPVDLGTVPTTPLDVITTTVQVSEEADPITAQFNLT